MLFALLALGSTAQAQLQPIEAYDLFGAPLYRPALEGAGRYSGAPNRS